MSCIATHTCQFKAIGTASRQWASPMLDTYLDCLVPLPQPKHHHITGLIDPLRHFRFDFHYEDAQKHDHVLECHRERP